MTQSQVSGGTQAVHQLLNTGDGRSWRLGLLLIDTAVLWPKRYDDETLENLPAAYTHELFASDVFMYAGEGLVALCGTHSAVERDRVFRAVARLLGENQGDEEGGGGPDYLQPHPGFAIDPDPFLWLVHRQDENTVLSDELELVWLRQLRGQNAAQQRSDFRDSATMDRAELLALIAQQGSAFGSAKLALLHKDLDLEIDMELSIDGSFSPFIGSSPYHADVVQDEALGVRLALDAAQVVIPDLYRAYAADQAWEEEQRVEFRTKARAQMIALVPR